MRSFYLAGGTAAALQLGHRRSLDVDFFSRRAVDPLQLRDALREHGIVSVKLLSEGSFVGAFRRTKLSCLHYPYPLLKPTHLYAGIALADLLDIACMKVDAISSRGKRRDFIDLCAIGLRMRYSLAMILDAFATKYRRVAYNRVHILKSLVYFADAERDPTPPMLDDLPWQRITAFFQREVARLH